MLNDDGDIDDYHDDMDDDYYEEDEDLNDVDWRTNKCNINVYEFHGLPLPMGFERTVWRASGEFRGDIKWSNSSLTIDWYLYYDQDRRNKQLSVKLEPFTKNCGIKAISYLYDNYNTDKLVRTFIKHVENFAYHCCNAGIIVGSDAEEDGYAGLTGRTIRTSGDGYVFTDLVWNPNYTWDSSHKVFLFHKDLAKVAPTYEDFWKP